MALITHQGISEAIASLQPNPATLKGRLINLIHSYFPTEDSLEEIAAIAAEDIVRQLWEVEDPQEIRQKKKNLSSLKSSINKDLKKLARKGKNPEGLIIGRDNVFTISDEHKNDLLQQLGLSGAVDPTDLLSLIRGILDTTMQSGGSKEVASSILQELDKTREMIAKAAGLGDVQQDSDAGGGTEGIGGDTAEGELNGTAEIPGTDGEGGTDAQPEAEDILDQEEFEILDDAEIIDQEAEFVEEDIGGAEDTREDADELLDEEELEILDEAEIIEQEEVFSPEAAGETETGLGGEDELAGTGQAAADEGEGGAQAEPEADELLDEEELEILDEAEIIEQEEDFAPEAAGETEAGLGGEEELAGTGQAAADEEEGGVEADFETDELLDEEELEILDEAEVIEQEEDFVSEAAGVTDDGLGGEEELAGTGQAAADEGEGGVEAEPEADELLDEEELEILDEDFEIVDEEDIAAAGGIAATDKEQQTEAHPLDLSHYIEPEEALASPPETLTETHDDYVAQILERFMPKFIKIPAGHYLIGREQPLWNERPAQKILLPDFYIGQLPVSNDLFDFFVRETGYETDAERTGFGNVVEGRISNRIDPDTGRTVLAINRGTSSQRMQGANWRHPAGPDSSLENKGNHPVVQVSRKDALAFAAWAGKRLPSEDEWEAAARGTEGRLFPWGNEWLGELTNTESSLSGDTSPVIRHGKPSMSPFGLYDLLGNVFEWTATVHTPTRPAGSHSPPTLYVLKGGCWTSKSGITAAARLLEPDTWSNTIGFRCAV